MDSFIDIQYFYHIRLSIKRTLNYAMIISIIYRQRLSSQINFQHDQPQI